MQDAKLLCKLSCKPDKKFEQILEYVNMDCHVYRELDIDIVMFPKGNALGFAVYWQKRRLQWVSCKLQSTQ